MNEVNPYALEEIGRRMLELEKRGKWTPDSDTLEKLKQNYLVIEGYMEGRQEPLGDIQGGAVDIVSHAQNQLWSKNLGDIDAVFAGLPNTNLQ